LVVVVLNLRKKGEQH